MPSATVKFLPGRNSSWSVVCSCVYWNIYIFFCAVLFSSLHTQGCFLFFFYADAKQSALEIGASLFCFFFFFFFFFSSLWSPLVSLVFVFFFEDLEGSVTETTNLNLWKMRTAKLVFSATNCRGTSPAIGTNMCLECFFSDWMEGWKGMGWMRCAVIKGFYFVGGGKLILWVYCIHLYTFKHKYFPPNPNLGMRE